MRRRPSARPILPAPRAAGLGVAGLLVIASGWTAGHGLAVGMDLAHSAATGFALAGSISLAVALRGHAVELFRLGRS